MLKLSPCFSLVFQALYESFLEPHWVAAPQSSLVDRQQKQISFQIHGLILAILNLLDLIKVKEQDKEMDSVKAELNSLLNDAKTKCTNAAEEKDVAVAKWQSLEGELARLTASVEDLTKRVDTSETKLAEATKAVKRRFAEGKAEGKKEAEAKAAAFFDAKRAEIIEELKASPELIDIRTKDFQSAGQQIFDLIKQEHPEWDLGFLYNAHLLAGDDNSSPPGHDSTVGGEA
ncbi:uncharacterized protein LOC112092960 [Morus notabilis]|uniref:uncharacterized protein LOC112092960 n=1 Tax=Morus notabilis TaxID=981085 RepID=UPI000CED6184|nr:uncharacterized protein LOC112092960 [Morus notabilis]